ncbi:hypothetical protein GCM10029963_24870 [Micromonospora andamanensis]|uniref:hypothetical protein n=1 Tax=Micromonospora andamanensis TaxID=1287068 RepID=UPI001A4C6DD2|nr:hypothetical protein [Micromonospora andamanensis]GIJ41992.1 hypothetical protein Vwe01_53170 [Micromonospora andamanensis]
MTERLQIGTDPESIRVLKAALVGGVLPDTYVSAGSLVHTEAVSGGLAAADEDSPLPVSASVVTPAGLAGLLAEHAYVYRLRARKSDTGAPEMRREGPEHAPPGGLRHRLVVSASASAWRIQLRSAS